MAIGVTLPTCIGPRAKGSSARTERNVSVAQQMRAHASNCEQRAERAFDRVEKDYFMRLADGWIAIGNEQAWLDGELRTKGNPA
jgi:hypothetical protein